MARGTRPATQPIRSIRGSSRTSTSTSRSRCFADFTIDTTRQQLLLGQKQLEISDLQLQQQLTQTARAVRYAYYDLVGAIGQLEVAQQSLELAKESLKNNERRVEVGTMPPIDIVEAQAEVSRNEEAVIVTEAQVKTLEDALRTLIMNPSQPDFWTTRIVPSEQPVLTPTTVDVEAAIRNALDKRTDLAQARSRWIRPTSRMKFTRNQKLPSVNAIVNYGLAGVAGIRTLYDTSGGYPVAIGQPRSATSARRCATSSATSSRPGASSSRCAIRSARVSRMQGSRRRGCSASRRSRRSARSNCRSRRRSAMRGARSTRA